MHEIFLRYGIGRREWLQAQRGEEKYEKGSSGSGEESLSLSSGAALQQENNTYEEF